MKNEIAKVLLLGQYGLQKYVNKQECLAFDMFELITYIRNHFKTITMSNLGFIMKGLAIVYTIQLHFLESSTKNLLSQINGDYAWNNFIKKIGKSTPVKAQGAKKKKGPVADNNSANLARPFNIMDAKQILAFTRERLEFLSSSSNSEKLQLQNLSETNSAIKDFAGEYNTSHADLFKNSAQPEDQNFNEIINDHVNDFMTSNKADDNLVGIMQKFLEEDHAMQLPQNEDWMFQLSLESNSTVPAVAGKKRDLRKNAKFQKFILGSDNLTEKNRKIGT